MLNVLGEKPAPSVDRAADEVAVNLLRTFGVAGAEPRKIVARPLPRPAKRSGGS